MLSIFSKTWFLLPLTIEMNKWLTIDFNFAIVDLLKPIEQANQCGFTGTGWPDD